MFFSAMARYQVAHVRIKSLFCPRLLLGNFSPFRTSYQIPTQPLWPTEDHTVFISYLFISDSVHYKSVFFLIIGSSAFHNYDGYTVSS